MKGFKCDIPQPRIVRGLSFLWQHNWLSTHTHLWAGLQVRSKGKTCLRGIGMERRRRPCSYFYFPGPLVVATEKAIGKPSSCQTRSPGLIHSWPLCVTQLPVWLMWSMRQRGSGITQHHQARREPSQDMINSLVPFHYALSNHHTVLNLKNKHRICWDSSF